MWPLHCFKQQRPGNLILCIEIDLLQSVYLSTALGLSSPHRTFSIPSWQSWHLRSKESFRCFWMFNASTFTDWSSSIFFIFTFKSKKSAGLPLIFSLWCSGVLLHIHQKAGGPRLWRIHGGNGALSSPEVSLLFSAGL